MKSLARKEAEAHGRYVDHTNVAASLALRLRPPPRHGATNNWRRYGSRPTTPSQHDTCSYTASYSRHNRYPEFRLRNHHRMRVDIRILHRTLNDIGLGSKPFGREFQSYHD